MGFFFRGNSGYSRNKHGFFPRRGRNWKTFGFFWRARRQKKGIRQRGEGGNRRAAGNVVEKRAQISINRWTHVNAGRSARRRIGG